jgi:hypothetical protein
MTIDTNRRHILVTMLSIVGVVEVIRKLKVAKR